MYILYFSKGTCSAATQIVLRELGQSVNIINVQKIKNFRSINPVGAVPVLIDGDKTITEGAAILLHLLNKHKSSLFPHAEHERSQAIQDIMFANATMHPAYSKLFFIGQHINNETVKQDAFNKAAEMVNALWKVVDKRLVSKPFLGGGSPSAADILLAVYSRWGAYFPVEITFGENTSKMIKTVQSMPSFIASDNAELAQSAA